MAEEPSFAGLSWDAHDARRVEREAASAALREDVERDWASRVGRGAPVSAEDAERAVRERLWAEHQARTQRADLLKRQAYERVAAENREAAAAKKVAEARLAAAVAANRGVDDAARAAWLRDAAPTDLPIHMARALPAEMRPATASARDRRAAEIQRHNALAAGRPRTASARASTSRPAYYDGY